MIFDGKPEELTDDYLEKIYTGKEELDKLLHPETEKV